VGAAPAAAQARTDTVLTEAAVEQRPQVVAGSCANPTYPVQMRAARMEGRVVLRFVVDTTGRIEPASVVVLQSTHQLFESAARRALLTCRYRPARFANRPVRVWVETPYNFRVTGS
jgi:protein TonB